MIITASPFFDESDLLEIRCRELAGLVDVHLIIEANLTSSCLTACALIWTNGRFFFNRRND